MKWFLFFMVVVLAIIVLALECIPEPTDWEEDEWPNV